MLGAGKIPARIYDLNVRQLVRVAFLGDLDRIERAEGRAGLGTGNRIKRESRQGASRGRAQGGQVTVSIARASL